MLSAGGAERRARGRDARCNVLHLLLRTAAAGAAALEARREAAELVKERASCILRTRAATKGGACCLEGMPPRPPRVIWGQCALQRVDGNNEKASNRKN